MCLPSLLILKTGILTLIFGIFSTPLFAAEKKGEYPDYTKLEYAKPLPPVDEQVKQPKPGSINRKFGELQNRAEAEADPLNSIPIPLLRPAAKPDDYEPSIAEILEEADLPRAAPVTSSAPTAEAKPAAAPVTK